MEHMVSPERAALIRMSPLGGLTALKMAAKPEMLARQRWILMGIDRDGSLLTDHNF